MNRVLAFLLLASSGLATADAPRISHNSLTRLEARVDSLLVKGDEPCQLLGDTRGVYLDGYGAVFTSMVSLVATPMPTPFSDFTQKDIEKVYERKVRQLPVMREKMRAMLLMMASDPGLDSVRPNEQVVYGVSFFYFKKWENMSGLPQQIVMQGEKQKLIDVQSGRIPRAQLDSIVKVQEL